MRTLAWESPKDSGDCHTSDIGHWFAMTSYFGKNDSTAVESFAFTLLTDEEDTQRAGTTMTGDGAAGRGVIDMPKRSAGIDCAHNSIHTFLSKNSMRQE